jgi:hypothetical protein
MSKHLPKLIKIAQEELPTLHNDALNATGPYQLREVVVNLVKIVTYVVQDIILDAYAAKTQPSQPSTVPPPLAPSPTRQLPVARPFPFPPQVASPQILSHPSPQPAPGLPRLPPPPDVAQPVPVAAAPASIPGDVPIQPGVTNVIITSQGTTAIDPRGQRTTLPPGEAVPIEATAGIPPVPPEAPEGVAQVVLPPGGGMTPELLEALGNRSQDQPPQEPEPAK